MLDGRAIELEVRREAREDELAPALRRHVAGQATEDVPPTDVCGRRDLALKQRVDVVVEPTVALAARQAGHSGETTQAGGVEVSVALGCRAAVGDQGFWAGEGPVDEVVGTPAALSERERVQAHDPDAPRQALRERGQAEEVRRARQKEPTGSVLAVDDRLDGEDELAAAALHLVDDQRAAVGGQEPCGVRPGSLELGAIVQRDVVEPVASAQVLDQRRLTRLPGAVDQRHPGRRDRTLGERAGVAQDDRPHRFGSSTICGLQPR